eukprot:TRINITY_DN1380_c0_g1_i1.p1 TRINITY_DN1380_c0_g1~~TRINITY_DN1380_c0_g1_i1.p1  ORF type:complete len:174 (+),score=35.05 TRINITY_DN1380_c0_g1_i1:25-522(+)
MAAVPALHPNLQNVKHLLGTWKGKGRGVYPTIQAFDYGEEVRFWHSGRPFLFYSQKTWNLQNGNPLHAETGFLRVPSPTKLELVLAQPSGVSSIEEGTVSEDGVISLSCNSNKIVRSETAKHPWVEEYTRVFRMVDGKLEYVLNMGTENQPMQHHLQATLEKDSE